jgi:gluconolactonase
MHKSFFVVLLSLFLLAGCATPEPEPEPVDHGAGTVLRADAAVDAIIPEDYKIEKLHGGFQFTEGPVWINKDGGYLLFSDIPANAVYKWTPDGQVTDFLKPVFEDEYEEGRYVGSNGLLLDPDGNLLLCEHGGRRVSRMGEDGTRTTVVDKYEGKGLNSPNDAVVHSDGSIYFTDPPYGFAQQDDDPAKELDFNGIYRYSADGKLTLLNRDQTRPNGIGFSPDEKTLYVANSDPNSKLWMSYPVNDDGTLAEGAVFFDASSEEADGMPDGLALDAQGNVYATGPGGAVSKQ